MNEVRDSTIAAFRFVAEIYENTASLLRAAEELLDRDGFVAYSNAWKPFSPQTSLQHARRWAPHGCVRQFHRLDNDKEVLTVAVVLPVEPDFDEPLVLGSYMTTVTQPDSVYWLALLQSWCRDEAPPDGVVRRLRNTSERLKADYERVLADPVLLSLAVPLHQVSSNRELDEFVIRPLLAEVRLPTVTK